jgi:4-hydroxy-3-methylbut-2-enyl diphosphate reductase
MKIVLANPRGFCAGVEMAIRCLEIVIQRLPAPIYVYHEIVHNRQVVERFQSEGVIFVEDVSDVPIRATLVFSAHGVSPAIRREARNRNLRTIDATCPLVAKVHTETVRFATLGYQIILVGHAGHDEVVGTIGEAPDRLTLVEKASDVDRLDLNACVPIAYLTQTTLGVDETFRIVEHLRNRYPQIVGPQKDDICYATQNRQHAVRELAVQADIVLVIGSQNSSNSRRLCEVAEEYCTAQLVDDTQQLTEDWFASDQTVGITAGASAPELSVQTIVAWLQARFDTEVVECGTHEPPRVFPLPEELGSVSK